MMKKNECGTFRHGVATFLGFLLLYYFSCCESCAYVCDLYLGVLSYFAIFDKNDKSLNPGNSVTFSARFSDLYVVFFACLYRLWTEAAATEAVAASSKLSSI